MRHCFVLVVPNDAPNHGHIPAPMEEEDDDDHDHDNDDDDDEDDDECLVSTHVYKVQYIFCKCQ